MDEGEGIDRRDMRNLFSAARAGAVGAAVAFDVNVSTSSSLHFIFEKMKFRLQKADKVG